MQVMVFFSIHPIGEGAHVGDAVAQAVRIIRSSGLEHELGPSGTTILGPWDDVFACLKACHEAVGAEGARVSSLIKVDQWDFAPGAIAAKVARVEARVARGRGRPAPRSGRSR